MFIKNKKEKKRNDGTGVLRISVSAEVIDWNYCITEIHWLIVIKLVEIVHSLRAIDWMIKNHWLHATTHLAAALSSLGQLHHSVRTSISLWTPFGPCTHFSANKHCSKTHECNDPGSGKVTQWKIRNHSSVTKTTQRARAAVHTAESTQLVASVIISTADLKMAALLHSSASSTERYRTVVPVDPEPVLMQ